MPPSRRSGSCSWPGVCWYATWIFTPGVAGSIPVQVTQNAARLMTERRAIPRRCRRYPFVQGEILDYEWVRQRRRVGAGCNPVASAQ